MSNFVKFLAHSIRAYQCSPLTLNNKFKQSKLINYSWLQYAGHLDSNSMLKLKLLRDKRSCYRTGTQQDRDHLNT